MPRLASLHAMDHFGTIRHIFGVIAITDLALVTSYCCDVTNM